MRYYVPRNVERSPPFRMVIEDIYTIKTRGVIVTGWMQAGTLRRTDTVLVEGLGKSILVKRIAFPVQVMEPDVNISLLLYDVWRDDIEIGMIVTTEGV